MTTYVPGPQIDDVVPPFAVGDDRANLFDERRTGGFDGDTGQHGAGRVSDGPGDAAASAAPTRPMTAAHKAESWTASRRTLGARTRDESWARWREPIFAAVRGFLRQVEEHESGPCEKAGGIYVTARHRVNLTLAGPVEARSRCRARASGESHQSAYAPCAAPEPQGACRIDVVIPSK